MLLGAAVVRMSKFYLDASSDYWTSSFGRFEGV